MATGTTTTGAQLLKQYWTNRFLETLYDDLAFTDIATKFPVPSNNGKVVWYYKLNRISPVGSTPSEGSDPTGRSASATRISATLAEYANMYFISRLAMDTSVGGTKEALIRDLGKDAAALVNSTIQSAALGGGTALYAKGKVHRSDVIKACTATVADIRKAVRLLQLSSVPMFDGQTYAGLLHPDVQFDIQTDSAWTNVNLYQQQAKGIFTGETGQLYNVRFKLAPTIPILVNSGSANVDIYRTLILGREFVAWSELDNLKLIQNEPAKTREMGVANAYGYYFRAVSTVLSNQKAARLESSSTLGTN